MSRLNFEFDWVDPQGAKGPELRATWARLRVAVDDHSITRLVDDLSRTVRDSVFLPLYPLAEWLVSNWWFLLYEVEAPGRMPERYAARHSWKSAREGFALPALTVVPLGSLIRLDWTAAHLPLQRVEFTEGGSAHVPALDFRKAVLDFVAATVARLREVGPQNTLLEEEFEAIIGADGQEEQFCRAAASLGVDPYSVDSRHSQGILEASERMPQSVVHEFFAVADIERLSAEVTALVRVLEISRSRAVRLDELIRLKDLVRGRITPRLTPWEQGYDLARAVRAQLGLDGTVVSSLQSLGSALGIDRPLSATVDAPNLVDAVVDINDDGSPAFAASERSERAGVFTLCRALGEYLAAAFNEPQIVTRARSENQKRNRAFAAEFLVPSQGLRERLPGLLLSEEDVEDLAGEYGVSPWLVRHQIENHNLAKILA